MPERLDALQHNSPLPELDVNTKQADIERQAKLVGRNKPIWIINTNNIVIFQLINHFHMTDLGPASNRQVPTILYNFLSLALE